MSLVWLPFGLTPQRKNGGVRYADIYSRILAALDAVLMLFILTPLYDWISLRFGIDSQLRYELQAARGNGFFSVFVNMLTILWHSDIFVLWLAERLFVILTLGAMLTFFHVKWGQTPGKKIMGLRIVDAKTLEPVSGVRFFLRFLAYIPATLPLTLGIIWTNFNQRRRGWHDYMAGTVVIHIRPEGWYWQHFKRFVRTYLWRKNQGPAAES